MENASKALIIAGAILLSIIIISLGIMVVNNARNQIGGANLSKEELTAFNSQWESYTSRKLSASELRGLFSAIITNNVTEQNAGTNRTIKITYAKDVLASGVAAVTNSVITTSVPTTIEASKLFKVTANYTNGLIDKLTITN